MSHITIRNFLFNNHRLVFHFYGTATFEHCLVYGGPFIIYLHKNSIESKITIENISSYSMAHQLKLFGTKFETLESRDYIWGFSIKTVECVRGIVVRNCTFKEISHNHNELSFHGGNEPSSDRHTATIVLIVDCFFSHFIVSFHVTPTDACGLSFLIVELNSVIFYNSYAYKVINGGMAAFFVQNCSFLGFESRPRCLHLMDVLYVSVTNCTFQTYNLQCWQGCAISVRGAGISVRKFIAFAKVFLMNVFEVYGTTLIIRGSQFIGSTAELSGGSVSCVDASLKVSNTVFQMTKNSKPPSVGGFIYHEILLKTSHFVIENVILDTSIYKNPAPLIFLSGTGNIKSLSLFCPQSMQPKLILKQSTTSISCEISCPEAYTFQAGNITFDMKVVFQYVHRNASVLERSTVCFPCPVGAVCNGTVRALPNYWGYKNQIGQVTMIRCPDGYCCHDNKTCTKFNSCHPERAGTLCGKCQKNLTES